VLRQHIKHIKTTKYTEAKNKQPVPEAATQHCGVGFGLDWLDRTKAYISGRQWIVFGLSTSEIFYNIATANKWNWE